MEVTLAGTLGRLVGDDATRDSGLTQRLDLSLYRRIMADATWDFVVEATTATRSYETGLEAGLLLLRFAETHRADVSPTVFEDHMMRLYSFVLDMLDRLDQWDTYLDAWAQIRANTNYAVPERRDVPVEAMGMAPFILRRDPETLWVHFLWELAYRKAVIERKVEARRQGRRLGNLLHHPPDELSEQELRRRVERLLQDVRTGWAWNSPSDDEQTSDTPPADPQWPNPVACSVTQFTGGAEPVGERLRLEFGID